MRRCTLVTKLAKWEQDKNHKSQFKTFCEISPEPIRAADGHTFSALGKGDIGIELPMGEGNKPTPVLFKNAFYSLNMAFTPISVSQTDCAGFTLSIQGGMCIIRSPKLK